MTSRRNTIQKDLVRNAVYEMKRHVTANEVYEFIKEEYPTIGKGTRQDRDVVCAAMRAGCQALQRLEDADYS